MINKLPPLKDASQYRGLYIFDFGDHVSVGYTIEEIEHLLTEPAYAAGRVYKINRARPDGTLEIRGVSQASLSRATGIAFWFRDLSQVQQGAQQLRRGAVDLAPPASIDVTICHHDRQDPAWVLVLRYVQDLDDAVATWLLNLNYDAGLIVEAGSRAVDQALLGAETIEHWQLQPPERLRPRSKDQVLQTTHFAVQR